MDPDGPLPCRRDPSWTPLDSFVRQPQPRQVLRGEPVFELRATWRGQALLPHDNSTCCTMACFEHIQFAPLPASHRPAQSCASRSRTAGDSGGRGLDPLPSMHSPCYVIGMRISRKPVNSAVLNMQLAIPEPLTFNVGWLLGLGLEACICGGSWSGRDWMRDSPLSCASIRALSFWYEPDYAYNTVSSSSQRRYNP